MNPLKKLFRGASRRTRKNPELLGVDVVDGAVTALGVFGTSLAKQRITDPLTTKIPFLSQASGLGHDLVNLGSAVAASAIVALPVQFFNKRFGRDVAVGAVAYDFATGMSIPFKGVAFDASLPQFFTNLRINAASATPAAPAAPAISSTSTASQDVIPAVPTSSSSRSKVAI